jgi:hypothetical protein
MPKPRPPSHYHSPSLDQLEDYACALSRALADSKGIPEGFQKVWREYVEQSQTHPGLTRFAALLLQAESAREASARLNQLRNLRTTRGRLLDDEQREVERLLELVCGFNQSLGSFIRKYRDVLQRTWLTQWLAYMASGEACTVRPVMIWSRSVIMGAVAEVVAVDILQGLVRNIRHGSVKADLNGKDLIFESTPRGILAVDVMSGRSRPQAAVSRFGNYSRMVVLSIDPGDIVGFRLRPDRMAHYRAALHEWL